MLFFSTCLRFRSWIICDARALLPAPLFVEAFMCRTSEIAFLNICVLQSISKNNLIVYGVAQGMLHPFDIDTRLCQFFSSLLNLYEFGDDLARTVSSSSFSPQDPSKSYRTWDSRGACCHSGPFLLPFSRRARAAKPQRAERFGHTLYCPFH